MGVGVWRLDWRRADQDVSSAQDLNVESVFSGLINEREVGWLNTGHLLSQLETAKLSLRCWDVVTNGGAGKLRKPQNTYRVLNRTLLFIMEVEFVVLQKRARIHSQRDDWERVQEVGGWQMHGG